MKRTPSAPLIASGVIIGGIVWMGLPLFLPLLMIGEDSSGNGSIAAFYVLSGPALVLPWTILGKWHPRLSGFLFLASALVNLVSIVLLEHNAPVRDMNDFFGLLITVIIPGPLLLLIFARSFIGSAKDRRAP